MMFRSPVSKSTINKIKRLKPKAVIRGNIGKTHAFGSSVFILALFVCVIFHEFGHALTAKRYNIQTKDVTVYPIGGVATLESMPRKPKQELMVAFAGPAVNIVIAAALWIYMQLSATMPVWTVLKNVDHMQTESFVFNLFVANIILAVFNLIPAFPMDGGRVLRALLAFKMDRSKATRIAAEVGQFLAILLVFLGFFFNFWLVFIGLFIYLGAIAKLLMKLHTAYWKAMMFEKC